MFSIIVVEHKTIVYVIRTIPHITHSLHQGCDPLLLHSHMLNQNLPSHNLFSFGCFIQAVFYPSLQRKSQISLISHLVLNGNDLGFIIQGGDPTGTGRGGESIYGKPFKVRFYSQCL